MSAMFRSLRIRDYRLWAAGALVSNIGTWMQRTAQDWIVFTELTRYDAAAVGITIGLQFAPQVLLLPLTGYAADRIPKRTLLIITQSVMGLLALGLGLLTVLGLVTLPQVYVFAFLLGCAAAFDAPARQSYVSELVGARDVSNAVALNSASFNAARLVGPAVAGLLVAAIGAGPVFLLNAASFAAVIVALWFVRAVPPEPGPREPAMRGLAAGFRLVASRPDLLVVFTMVFLLGAFGLNFPIYASTMAVLFEQGAGGYGLLSTAVAVGAVSGALLAARRTEPRFGLIVLAGLLFAAGLLAGAAAPSFLVLALVLPLTGVASQTFLTTANASVQLAVAPEVRGRVMAIYLAVFLGGSVVGAPAVGAVANAFGPRAALLTGACAGLAAALLGAVWLWRTRGRAVLPALGASARP